LGIEFVRPASFARAFDGLGNVPDKAFEDRVALIDIDEQDPLEFIRREKPLFDVSVTGSPINADARSVFAWPHKFGGIGIDWVSIAIIARTLLRGTIPETQAKINY
jgi:hypothetical protein